MNIIICEKDGSTMDYQISVKDIYANIDACITYLSYDLEHNKFINLNKYFDMVNDDEAMKTIIIATDIIADIHIGDVEVVELSSKKPLLEVVTDATC